MVKRVAAALIVSSAAATLFFAGGLVAAGNVQINDISRTAFGAGYASTPCDTSVNIKIGAAKYNAEYGQFTTREVLLSEIASDCIGLTATVVGTDSDGHPLVKGSSPVTGDSAILPLSSEIAANTVETWHVSIQSSGDDVGGTVTAPSLSGGISVIPEPSASDTPSPTESVIPEPSASDTPSPTESVIPEPSASDTPSPTESVIPEPSASDTPAEGLSA